MAERKDSIAPLLTLDKRDETTETVIPPSEEFLKKIKKWKRSQRGDDNLHGYEPSHRKATLRAVESGDRLSQKLQEDNKSLETVAANLEAMNSFVKMTNNEESSKGIDMTAHDVTVGDCLKVKNDTKEHVKTMQKSLLENKVSDTEKFNDANVETLPRKKGMIGDAIEENTISSHQNGLKLAKLHNKARLNRIKQGKSNIKGKNNNQEDKDHTFLTEMDQTADEMTTVNNNLKQSEHTSPPRNEGVDDRKNMCRDTDRFINEATPKDVGIRWSTTRLSADDVHTPPEKDSRNKLRSPNHKKILEEPLQHPNSGEMGSNQPTALSKYNHHGMSEPNISVHDAHALQSAVIKRKQMAVRNKSSSRRNFSSQNDDDFLEEEIADRQLMWLMKVEAKNRAAKREKDSRIIDELKLAPNISSANASWAKAKRSHERELNKEKMAEGMKKKLDEMKNEMHQLRMEEKAIRLRQRHFERRSGKDGSEHKPKKKSKKRKKKKSVGADSISDKDKSMGHDSSGRIDLSQKPHQHIPVTARGVNDAHTSIGGSGVKQLLKLKQRPKSANAVMKWSTPAKQSNKNFDVLDMVLSPCPSDEGVFPQLPSSHCSKNPNEPHKLRGSPFAAQVSSGGWVDGDNVKERESFGPNASNNVDVATSHQQGRQSTQHDEEEVAMSMHQRHLAQQQFMQNEYLEKRPYLPRHAQPDGPAPPDATVDSSRNKIGTGERGNVPSYQGTGVGSYEQSRYERRPVDESDGYYRRREAAQNHSLHRDAPYKENGRHQTVNEAHIHQSRQNQYNSVHSGYGQTREFDNSRRVQYDNEDCSVLSNITEDRTYVGNYIMKRTGAQWPLKNATFDNRPSQASEAYSLQSASQVTEQESRSFRSASDTSSAHSRGTAGRFFDQTSTADKGRFRVHDARDFDTKSMFRKPDPVNNAVTLLMGKKRNSDTLEIITVLFDRAKFSEEGARMWWNENRERLLGL